MGISSTIIHVQLHALLYTMATNFQIYARPAHLLVQIAHPLQVASLVYHHTTFITINALPVVHLHITQIMQQIHVFHVI